MEPMDQRSERETARPHIDKKLYNRAERYCIGKNESPNRLFEYSFDAIFTEDGKKTEGMKRLERFAEEQDVEISEALDRVLKAIIEEDGEGVPKFKMELERSVDE